MEPNDFTIDFVDPPGAARAPLWLTSCAILDDDEAQANDPYCVQLRTQLERAAQAEA